MFEKLNIQGVRKMTLKPPTIFLIVLLNIIISVISCTSVEFVKTGEEYPPLGQENDVKVLLIVDKNQFDEIGIADIGGVSLPVRIEKAKQVARSKGGDVIVPATICDEDVQKRIRSGYIVQTFYILKTKSTPVDQKEVQIKPTTPQHLEEDFIPEKQSLTFEQILQNYPTLQGQVYTNDMVPLRFYKIPPSLMVYGLTDYKLCLMQFDEQNTVLVFIPKEKIATIKLSIDMKKTVAIDFTPLGVYKDKYPVLKMILQ